MMTRDLSVSGFGVEITIPDEPKQVYSSSGPTAAKSSLKNLDYTFYGTRHRSMMRYCWHITGSIGFVVSQDGDVRAVTKVGKSLVFWDNIKLQLPQFLNQHRGHIS